MSDATDTKQLLRPPRWTCSRVSWVALIVAILLDVAQVFMLDYGDGFHEPIISTVAIVGFFAELYLFSIALRNITATVGYALFGLSSVLVAVISMGFLDEPLTLVKCLAIAMVLAGAVLLETEGANP